VISYQVTPLPSAFNTIVLGGLTAGVLDILAAFGMALSRGGSPVRVLQFIASGVLGQRAFQGGASSAALGLLFHFVIALGAATVYLLASRRWKVLLRHPWPSGALFGIAVYVFMNAVVLPLAGFPAAFPTGGNLAIGLVIHMTCVGLPIALFASRSTSRDAAFRQG
jgi:hypothetical protein